MNEYPGTCEVTHQRCSIGVLPCCLTWPGSPYQDMQLTSHQDNTCCDLQVLRKPATFHWRAHLLCCHSLGRKSPTPQNLQQSKAPQTMAQQRLAALMQPLHRPGMGPQRANRTIQSPHRPPKLPAACTRSGPFSCPQLHCLDRAQCPCIHLYEHFLRTVPCKALGGCK